jgi:hypothetical protein
MASTTRQGEPVLLMLSRTSSWVHYGWGRWQHFMTWPCSLLPAYMKDALHCCPVWRLPNQENSEADGCQLAIAHSIHHAVHLQERCGDHRVLLSLLHAVLLNCWRPVHAVLSNLFCLLINLPLQAANGRCRCWALASSDGITV